MIGEQIKSNLSISSHLPQIVKFPGTCGEFIQGQLLDGQDFLISNIIDRFSIISVQYNYDSKIIKIVPKEHSVKIFKMAKLVLKYLNSEEIGLIIHRKSELQIGKGQASSSAELAGTAKSLGSLLGYQFSNSELDRLLTHIEPTNPVYYSKPVIYNHKWGIVYEFLDFLPPLNLIVFVGEKSVNTCDFNNKKRFYDKSERLTSFKALNLFCKGVLAQNLNFISKASTLSAELNQSFNFNDKLDLVKKIALKQGAYGINVSHSGMCIGCLFPQDSSKNMSNLISEIRDYYPDNDVYFAKSLLNRFYLNEEMIEWKSSKILQKQLEEPLLL
ncbi:MAG: hypothetical protein ACFFG0_25895 [Candidatus Thorarchaeota archaeon]